MRRNFDNILIYLVVFTFGLSVIYAYLGKRNLWMVTSRFRESYFKRDSSNSSYNRPTQKWKMKNPPLIIYNRVGKCGSRSLIDITERLAIMKGFSHHTRNYPTKGPWDSLSQEQVRAEMSFISNLSRPGVYTSHLHYLNFKNGNSGMDFPVVYINMIRDPVDRFESNYNFNIFGDKRVARVPRNDQLNPMDINACVRKHEWNCTPTKFIEQFFCGYHKNCDINLAKRNIERSYVLVGLTEEFDSTLQLLEKILPDYYEGASAVWENIRKNSIEETKSIKQFTLTKESRQILKNRLQQEYSFYNWVKERFQEQKRRFSID